MTQSSADDSGGPTTENEEAASLEPAGSRSRAQTLILTALGTASVVAGFAIGRALRTPDAEPAQSFAEAPVPTIDSAGPAFDGVLTGEPAPDFKLTDVATGQDISLSDYAGRPVLVNFWATWCPPCRLEMPWLQAAQDQHAHTGFTVLAVNAGERVPLDQVQVAIQSFRDEYGLTFPLVHGDGTYAIQSDWGVWGLPASFLVDSRGQVVDTQIGVYASQEDLESRLELVLPDPD
jgi:thiol-disulfide isomerase/thioredoxin